MEEEYQNEIVIDCQPGPLRPNDVLKNVLEEIQFDECDNPLKITDFINISKAFGIWVFVIKNKNNEPIYDKYKDSFGEKLKEYYKMGIVRYAHW